MFAKSHQTVQIIVTGALFISATHSAIAESNGFGSAWPPSVPQHVTQPKVNNTSISRQQNHQTNQQTLDMLRGEGIQLPYCETWHANSLEKQPKDNIPSQQFLKYQQPESSGLSYTAAPSQSDDDGLGFARDALQKANEYLEQKRARLNQERATQKLPQLSGDSMQNQMILLRERVSRDIQMANKIGRGEATPEETAAFDRRMKRDIAIGGAMAAHDKIMLNHQKADLAQRYRKESTNAEMQAGQSPYRYENPFEPLYWLHHAEQYDKAAKDLLKSDKKK